MKKALLSLFLAFTCMPVFAQLKGAPIVVPVNITRCTPYTWAVTGDTYDHDTVLMVRHTVGDKDTVYVLNLIVDSTNIGRKDTAVTAKCVYIWRDSLAWDTAGTYTVTIADPDGCDSVYTVDLTLTGGPDSAMLGKKEACGKYMAPWGELFTQDTIIDTTYTTEKGCQRRDSIVLKINQTYEMPLETVEANCSYFWSATLDTIYDNQIHREVLKTKKTKCDSIVSIQVNMTFHIDTTYDTVVCDKYFAPWDSIHPYTATGTQVHSDTSATGCITTTTVELTVNNSFTDTAWALDNTIDTTIGCYLTWGDTTINSITADTVLRRLSNATINGCDSVAAVHVIALNYKEHVDSTVTPCAHPFKWRPYTGKLFTFSNDTICLDTNIVGTGATACTTYYSLNLNFADSTAVLKRPRRCEYDSIKIGTPRYSFRIENGDTVTRKFTGSNNNPTISVIDRNNIFVYNSNKQCTTYYDVKLNIITPSNTIRKDTIVRCDKFMYDAYDNMLFTHSTDTTLIKSKRPDLITYTGNNHHAVGDCSDRSFMLKLTIHYSDTLRDDIDTCDSYNWIFNDSIFTYNRNVNITRKSKDTNSFGCAVYGTLNLNIRKTPVSYITGDWRLAPDGSTTLHAVSQDSTLTYAWYENGTYATDGDTYEVTDRNNHENIDILLTASNGNGCPDSNWLTIVFAPIGIDDVEGVDVSIFPNPATRFVNLRTSEAISTVSVFNAIGQQVMLRQGDGEDMQIDLTGLASGHYTMRIRTVEGHEAIRKFIVNK